MSRKQTEKVLHAQSRPLLRPPAQPLLSCGPSDVEGVVLHAQNRPLLRPSAYPLLSRGPSDVEGFGQDCPEQRKDAETLELGSPPEYGIKTRYKAETIFTVQFSMDNEDDDN